MSRDDEVGRWIENMQRAIAAWNREDLDEFLATWHPECEWRPAFPRSLEGVGVVYQGREGIARAWQGVRGRLEGVSPRNGGRSGRRRSACGCRSSNRTWDCERPGTRSG